MEPFWLDAAVAGVLLYAVIRGAMKGLVWQLAWIAAIVICFALSETVSVKIAPWIPVDPPLNHWLAMLGLYLVSLLVCCGIAWRLHDWLEKWRMKSVDRQLGAALGLLKGALFSLAALFFVVTYSPAVRQTALQSKSGYAAAVVMQRMHDVLPAEYHDVLHPYIHTLDKAHPEEAGHSHDGHSHSGAKPFPTQEPRPGQFEVTGPPAFPPEKGEEGRGKSPGDAFPPSGSDSTQTAIRPPEFPR